MREEMKRKREGKEELGRNERERVSEIGKKV
jgi:hypothetical protein